MKQSTQDVKINRAFKSFDFKYKDIYDLTESWAIVPRVLYKYLSLTNNEGVLLKGAFQQDEVNVLSESLNGIYHKKFDSKFYESLSCLLLDDNYYKKQNKSAIKFMENVSEESFKNALPLFQKATVLNPLFDDYIRKNIHIYPDSFQKDLIDAISQKECLILKVANFPDMKIFDIKSENYPKESKVVLGFYKSPKKIMEMTLKKGGEQVVDILLDIAKISPEYVIENLKSENLEKHQKLKDLYLSYLKENFGNEDRVAKYNKLNYSNSRTRKYQKRLAFMNTVLIPQISNDINLIHVIKEDQALFNYLMPELRIKVTTQKWEDIASETFKSLGGEFDKTWVPLFGKTKIVKKLISERTDIPEYLRNLAVLNPGLSENELNKNVVPTVIAASITAEQSNSSVFWTNYIEGFNSRSKYSDSLKKKIKPMVNNEDVYDALVKSGTSVAGSLLLLFKVDRDIQKDLFNNVKNNVETFDMIPEELKNLVNKETVNEAVRQYSDKGNYNKAFAIVSGTSVYRDNWVEFQKAAVLTYFAQEDVAPKLKKNPKI